MPAKPPRTLFSVDAVFPKLMLMCTSAIGGMLLGVGVLVGALVVLGRASGPSTTFMWWCIGLGIALMVTSRLLFGRFLRGYLGDAERGSVD